MDNNLISKMDINKDNDSIHILDEKIIIKPTPNEIGFRHQIGITLLFSVLATVLFLLLRMISKMDISKIFLPSIAFPLNLLVINIIYPRKLQFPFKDISSQEFRKRIGLATPKHSIALISVGFLMGLLSLVGMLIGSLLTQRYVFDIQNLTVEQVIFATVPGVWEEVFYRGILMIVLIKRLKDIKKSMIIQIVIFGLLHFYGIGVWDLVDLFSIALIGTAFTYAAFKTNSIIPSIIFHFLHDAFIYLVQTPDAIYYGTFENVVFFGSLWIMIGLGCLLTKWITEKWNIAEERLLYNISQFET